MKFIKDVWKYLTKTDSDSRDYIYTCRYGGFHMDIDQCYQKKENLDQLKKLNNSKFAKSLIRRNKRQQISEEPVCMLGIDIILIPILAGFLFIKYCNFTRFL